MRIVRQLNAGVSSDSNFNPNKHYRVKKYNKNPVRRINSRICVWISKRDLASTYNKTSKVEEVFPSNAQNHSVPTLKKVNSMETPKYTTARWRKNLNAWQFGSFQLPLFWPSLPELDLDVSNLSILKKLLFNFRLLIDTFLHKPLIVVFNKCREVVC